MRLPKVKFIYYNIWIYLVDKLDNPDRCRNGKFYDRVAALQDGFRSSDEPIQNFIDFTDRWRETPTWDQRIEWNKQSLLPVNSFDNFRNFEKTTDWNKKSTGTSYSISHKLPNTLVILQPSPFCNIDCRYCYLPNRKSKDIMTEETVQDISRVIFSSPSLKRGFTVLWHAGEPMAVPKQFYEMAFGIMQESNKYHVPSIHNFQTNGTLITQEWCELIKTSRVQIGVSLDGPKFIHDMPRVHRNGKGTFDEVMRGIKLLQKNDIPFGVIAVLTSESLKHPDEIFSFFTSNGIYNIGFNNEEIEGANRKSSLDKKVDTALRYNSFFDRILQLSQLSQTPVRIREIENMINRIKGNNHKIISNEQVPLEIVTFDSNGNMSTFSPELLTMSNKVHGDFVFGNAKNMKNVEEALANEKLSKINDEIKAGIKSCRRDCEYFVVCGGGSPSNKFSENGTFDSTETMDCKLKIKEIENVTLTHLEKLQRRVETTKNNKIALKT